MAERVQMTAVILFVMSIVALIQFMMYYWRATIANIAKESISDRVLVAAGITATTLRANDFRALLNVHGLTPDLSGSGSKFHAIRVYYFAVERFGRLLPPIADWAEVEMLTCSRYLAVQIGRHLESNLVCSNGMRDL
ncbi:MAG: hypothetical protein ACRD4Y_18450 [Candidatus Acidiferrales bacterium]